MQDKGTDDKCQDVITSTNEIMFLPVCLLFR